MLITLQSRGYCPSAATVTGKCRGLLSIQQYFFSLIIKGSDIWGAVEGDEANQGKTDLFLHKQTHSCTCTSSLTVDLMLLNNNLADSFCQSSLFIFAPGIDRIGNEPLYTNQGKKTDLKHLHK